MKSKVFFLVGIAVILLLGAGIFFFKKLSVPQKTHYHAGFVVFENNKQISFSDIKYMFLEPCILNKKGDDSTADIQIEKAHLHDNVGELVHIERTGAIWHDLFTNMHYAINYARTTGYINGRQVNNFQMQPIHPFDSLVVFIGENDPNLLKQAVTKNYMITMAKKSTTCGD